MELTLSIEDYAAAAAAAAFTKCEQCGKTTSNETLIETNDGQAFCSTRCEQIANAPLIKPQPKTTGSPELKGWTW